MSGAIYLTADEAWTASNSPYRWSVDYLATKVTHPQAKSSLRDIVEHGFDTIDLTDPAQFDSEARQEVLRLLGESLVTDAEDRLPGDLNDRDGYLDVLRELARLAQRVGRQA